MINMLALICSNIETQLELTGWPASPSSPFSPASPSVPYERHVHFSSDCTVHLPYCLLYMINFCGQFYTYSNTWLSRRARVSRESNRTLKERNVAKIWECCSFPRIQVIITWLVIQTVIWQCDLKIQGFDQLNDESRKTSLHSIAFSSKILSPSIKDHCSAWVCSMQSLPALMPWTDYGRPTGLPLGPSSPGGPLAPAGPAAPGGPASPFSPLSPLGPCSTRGWGHRCHKERTLNYCTVSTVGDTNWHGTRGCWRLMLVCMSECNKACDCQYKLFGCFYISLSMAILGNTIRKVQCFRFYFRHNTHKIWIVQFDAYAANPFDTAFIPHTIGHWWKPICVNTKVDCVSLVWYN